MKMLSTLPKMLLLLPLLAWFAGQAAAQAVPSLESIQSQAELDKAIASLDAALFDSYNRCDLEKFATFFADDVEFYHDQGGVTLGKEKLTESVKKNICGKVTRELVPGGRREVHPFVAIQRRRLEDYAGDQLRPPRRRQVRRSKRRNELRNAPPNARIAATSRAHHLLLNLD